MKLLRQIFDFYLNASIHVALAVVSFYFVSLEIFKVSTNYRLAGFLFFGTIVCYNFIKYGVEAKKYLIVSNPYHRLIQIFSFLAFFGACYFFIGLSKNLWIAILILVLVSTLYAVPFLPQTKNLRSLGGMKIYLVAFVWMGCTLLLPIVDNDLVLNTDFIVLMLQRVLVVLILLIPFEIRDLSYDDTYLRTLPQRIGVGRSKLLAYFLIGIYIVLSFLRSGLVVLDFIVELFFGAVLFVTIFLTKEKQSKYFASFWVEALPVLYLGICIFFKNVI